MKTIVDLFPGTKEQQDEAFSLELVTLSEFLDNDRKHNPEPVAHAELITPVCAGASSVKAVRTGTNVVIYQEKKIVHTESYKTVAEASMWVNYKMPAWSHEFSV
jgi:hypothetical protein